MQVTGLNSKKGQQNSGIVFDIKRFAIHDGAGIRTTIFLKGCPLSCWWCHNPESQQKKPEIDPARGAIGKRMTLWEVIEEIRKDIVFYDESIGGVTFSGGEPLSQAGFLSALLEKCRELDIHTVLDTSGYAHPDVFNSLVEKPDHFLYDLKIMDDHHHIKYTGVSNNWINHNLKTLDQRGKPVNIRFPVIPGITDSEQNIESIISFISALKHIQSVDILPFHRGASDKYRRLKKEYHMAGVTPPAREDLDKIMAKFSSCGFSVRIGG